LLKSDQQASTGRDSPRRATYFLGARQESRQRNAPRRLAGCAGSLAPGGFTGRP